MGLFEHFPYTNLHELNLDWILRKVQDLSLAIDDLDPENVRNEIATVIQQMIRDGSMAALLEQIALNGRLVTSKSLEDTPQQPSHYTVRSDLAGLTSTELYSLYDAMTSDAFERHLWGTDETGKDLVYYTFACDADRRTAVRGEDSEPSGEYAYSRQLAYTSNRIIITSGTHGDEKQNMWTLYHIVRAILNGEGPAFEYIRSNINLTILPIVNPWGMDQSPAQRRNSNDVDINRNFPYAWDSSTSPYKGASAGSERSTQFVMSVVNSYKDRRAFNGTVIIDFHDFFGSEGEYIPLYFLASATNPEYRIALSKAGMKFLDYLESAYPSIIEGISRPVRVTNIGSATPTFHNWAFHQGFRYTQLHECRTYAVSQSETDRFDAVTNNMAWYSMCLSLCSVAALFVGGERLYHISTVSELGLTGDYSLEDLVAAMPPRTCFSMPVYSGSALFDDLPGSDNGVLSVDSANWTNVLAVRLTFQTFSVSSSKTYTATAWAQSGSDVTVSDWQELATV